MNFNRFIFTNKTTLTLNGGIGTDTFTIDNNNTPTGLTGINVDGGIGIDSLLVNAFAAAVNVSTAGGLSVIGQPAVDYSNIGRVTVNNVLNSVDVTPAMITAAGAGKGSVNVTAAAFTGGWTPQWI